MYIASHNKNMLNANNSYEMEQRYRERLEKELLQRGKKWTQKSKSELHKNCYLDYNLYQK